MKYYLVISYNNGRTKKILNKLDIDIKVNKNKLMLYSNIK